MNKRKVAGMSAVGIVSSVTTTAHATEINNFSTRPTTASLSTYTKLTSQGSINLQYIQSDLYNLEWRYNRIIFNKFIRE
ncbi:hypothetical protein NSA50_14370 [Clostridium sp. DSM 100503]|uniref:hypothetical protein n=1 Tax=Clostridium sp. DSM 100503 TaxID=2963282 RepID=UPI00214A4527|nr:hypothetical protein [Clostridium sp. DSM 100503]MCR1952218.1 hypothetical protein [Clostridium sp. DSM 100503]